MDLQFFCVLLGAFLIAVASANPFTLFRLDTSEKCQASYKVCFPSNITDLPDMVKDSTQEFIDDVLSGYCTNLRNSAACLTSLGDKCLEGGSSYPIIQASVNMAQKCNEYKPILRPLMSCTILISTPPSNPDELNSCIKLTPNYNSIAQLNLNNFTSFAAFVADPESKVNQCQDMEIVGKCMGEIMLDKCGQDANDALKEMITFQREAYTCAGGMIQLSFVLMAAMIFVGKLFH